MSGGVRMVAYSWLSGGPRHRPRWPPRYTAMAPTMAPPNPLNNCKPPGDMGTAAGDMDKRTAPAHPTAKPADMTTTANPA